MKHVDGCTVRSGRTMAVMFTLLAGCGAMDEASAPKKDHDAGGPTLDAKSVGLGLLVETQGTIRPGDRVVVSAETGLKMETYSWTVSAPPDAGTPQVAIVDPATGWRRIAFDVGKAGSYTISCTGKLAAGGIETAYASVQVESPNAPKRVFVARIIPPPSTELPPDDWPFDVAGEDIVDQTWVIKAGISKTFAATVGGKPVEATVRLLAKADDPYPRDLFLSTAASGTPVKVNGIFHALVLPVDTKLAPNLYPDLDAGVIAQSWVAELSAQTKVAGLIRHAGSGLAGAKVTLHRKAANGIIVPSSIALTDASGAFQVEAQSAPGTSTLAVVPPPATGLPIAQVENVGTPAALQGWQLDYAVPAPVLSSGKVLRADGKPASGATVVLAMADGGQVGTLTIPGASALPAKGRFLVTLVSDASGVLRDPATQAAVHKLPAGTYTAELWPGKAETIEQGYRLTSVALSASASSFELALAPRALLSGKVEDKDGKPVLATVSARSAVATFVASTSLAKGDYTMWVDANTSYALTARPLDGSRLGSFYLPALPVAQAATANVALPRAVRVTGWLKTPGGSVVKDALIRVQCTSPSCIGQGVVDEARSDSKGAFVLRIPTEAP